jgi:trypsin
MKIPKVFLVSLTLAVTVESFPNLAQNTSTNSKIVGGEPASIEEYPYQISIQHYGQHICGGVLLNSDTVVTTA